MTKIRKVNNVLPCGILSCHTFIYRWCLFFSGFSWSKCVHCCSRYSSIDLFITFDNMRSLLHDDICLNIWRFSHSIKLTSSCGIPCGRSMQLLDMTLSASSDKLEFNYYKAYISPFSSHIIIKKNFQQWFCYCSTATWNSIRLLEYDLGCRDK